MSPMMLFTSVLVYTSFTDSSSASTRSVNMSIGFASNGVIEINCFRASFCAPIVPTLGSVANKFPTRVISPF